MIWFAVFFSLIALAAICTRWFVPVEHLQNYAGAPKDLTYWLAACLYNAIWVTAAYQHVLDPIECDWRVRAFGVALFIASQVLVIYARRVNDLFVPNLVYVPPRWRVKHGPYRALRHPGYTAFICCAVASACLLGSTWAGFPAALYVGLIINRIMAEDRMLSGKHFT